MPSLSMAPTQGDLVKYDDNPDYTRETVTLLAGTSYPLGAVLGKITASGKYKLATATGTDGAQVASAVLIEAVDATAADATGVVLARGPAIVSDAQLVYDATVTTAAQKTAKIDQLKAAGIVPRTAA